jgi:hypothetical protein
MRPVFIALFAVLLTATAVSAQSLGEVARQEEARRAALRGSGKVYTNESLHPEGTPAPGTAPVATDSAKPVTAPSGAATPLTDDKKDEPKKDEAYWRGRVKAERDALDRAQTFADALQSRVNGLSTDFAARDDPFQRTQISADRNKALAELDRVKAEIQQHTKAISDIQEEARKAGAPAGWTR